MSRREIRALQIVSEGGVTELAEGLFVVTSQSDPGKRHLVRVADGSRTCDCEDFANRRKCKHIYAVTYYLMLKNIVLNVSRQQLNLEISCPHCGLKEIVRSGYRYNKSGPVQRYYCKLCRKWFRDPDAFTHRKFSPHVIVTALDLYCRGLSLREVEDHLRSTYNVEVSYGTIYSWIRCYVELVHKYTSTLTKNVSERWCADETLIRVRGRDLFLWSLLDYKTRLLIAHHISNLKNAKEAGELIKKGYKNANGHPLEIVSDGNVAYQKALQTEVEHKPLIHIIGPLSGPVSNNRVEKLNQTICLIGSSAFSIFRLLFKLNL